MTLTEQWRPALDHAIIALAAQCGETVPDERMRTRHEHAARLVLDASGANDEIMRLRGVLYSALHTIATLRALYWGIDEGYVAQRGGHR